MNRFLLTALTVGCLFLFVDDASAQHRRGPHRHASRHGCAPVRGVVYTTPYYSYRSYGPGTHISRYAVPTQTVRRVYVPGSVRYGVPGYYSRSIYHSHPHTHFYGVPNRYAYPYGRNGLSLSIGF